MDKTLLMLYNNKSCICHSMATLSILCIVTLTYIFKIIKLEMLISGKTVRANENCLPMIFIEVGILHLMVSLRMLYSVTLTLIFKAKHLKRLYLENVES